jgi:hypothetical protein
MNHLEILMEFYLGIECNEENIEVCIVFAVLSFVVEGG